MGIQSVCGLLCTCVEDTGTTVSTPPRLTSCDAVRNFRLLNHPVSQPFLVYDSHSVVSRDLGVRTDNGLTASVHISKTVAGCFTTLCQLLSVRRFLSQETFKDLSSHSSDA